MGNCDCKEPQVQDEIISPPEANPVLTDTKVTNAEMEKEKVKKDHEARQKKEREEKEQKERERQQKEKKDREQREANERAERERLERERLEKLGPLGKPGAKLQVMLEDGWKDCDQEQVKQMCDQIAGGMPKFGITSRGQMYIIEWDGDKGTQTHATTKKTRQLRVV
eukprot:TRINITY_DN888_c0_g1_i1.p1 TRINITY_DN888_c0_g1~~TRINITY_DN888_c0_g1_i1.p1  ORF type:complete len:167 (+),score=46.09 TRINITY_DN888_c0_g1_i1:73-573(+)